MALDGEQERDDEYVCYDYNDIQRDANAEEIAESVATRAVYKHVGGGTDGGSKAR